MDSNNTENMFCVLGRVPLYTLYMNLRCSYVLYVIYQTWGARMNLGNVSNYTEKVL